MHRIISKTGFIRFVFGDFMVVIMLFYFLKSFVETKPLFIAIVVLLFAFIIEFLQLSSLLTILNLKQHKLANLILGNTFEVTDLAAYTLGIISTLIIEKERQNINSITL